MGHELPLKVLFGNFCSFGPSICPEWSLYESFSMFCSNKPLTFSPQNKPLTNPEWCPSKLYFTNFQLSSDDAMSSFIAFF